MLWVGVVVVDGGRRRPIHGIGMHALESNFDSKFEFKFL